MRALGEAIKSIQGPLGSGKDFKLNGDVQICILEGPSSFRVNELDESKPVRRLKTSRQMIMRGHQWLWNGEEIDRVERDAGIRIHRA